MVNMLKIQRAHIILQLKNLYKIKIDNSQENYKWLLSIWSVTFILNINQNIFFTVKEIKYMHTAVKGEQKYAQIKFRLLESLFLVRVKLKNV